MPSLTIVLLALEITEQLEDSIYCVTAARHSNERPFKCEQCDYAAKVRSTVRNALTLSLHVKRSHSEPKSPFPVLSEVIRVAGQVVTPLFPT